MAADTLGLLSRILALIMRFEVAGFAMMTPGGIGPGLDRTVPEMVIGYGKFIEKITFLRSIY